ncbi:MAG: DUF378 domain-containing protein [bacterium]|nr:DUF378 domain-containing protein [bacterium]
MNFICRPLVIIGALNWGLIGAFNFNLVEVLFGTGMIARIVYLLVGIAGLCLIYSYTQPKSKKD